MKDEVFYQKFGPLLLEAAVDLILDEINLLRTKAGLSEKTKQQMVDTLSNKIDSLTSLKVSHDGTV